MYWSASNLIKCSAKQLRYYHLTKEEKEVTIQMIEGEKYQKKNSKKDSLKEMRGIYKYKDNSICFVIDEIINNCFIEHKMVKEYVQWYFEQSLLQTALYKSYILNGCVDFETASFYVKMGNKKKICKVDPKWNYILNFGGTKYIITILNKNKLIKYFNKKIDCVLSSWDDAKEWDKLHKFKDFKFLGQYFKYNLFNIN